MKNIKIHVNNKLQFHSTKLVLTNYKSQVITYHLNDYHNKWYTKDREVWDNLLVYVSFFEDTITNEVIIYKLDVININSDIIKKNMNELLILNKIKFKPKHKHSKLQQSKIIVTFGKHKNKYLHQIPIQYLKWITSQTWFKKHKLYNEIEKYVKLY